MTSQVVVVNHLRQVNPQIALTLLESQVAAPPLPIGYLNDIGVRFVNDTTAGAGDGVTRTVTLGFEPSMDAAFTAARAENAGAGPITGLTMSSGGLDYVAPPILKILDASLTSQPFALANAVAFLNLGKVNLITGGNLYTAPIVAILDDPSPGGVAAEVTAAFIPGGAITGFTIVSAGGPYRSPPRIAIFDPTGSGATVTASLQVGGATLLTEGGGYVTPVVTVTPLFKYQWPDSIGAVNQGKPFVGLIKHAIEVAAASPVEETYPAVT